MSSRNINGPSPAGIVDPRAGKKRRRDSDTSGGDERRRVRIKTEPTDRDHEQFECEDEGGPPTPPVPRTSQEEDHVYVKTEETLPPDSLADVNISIADVFDHTLDTEEITSEVESTPQINVNHTAEQDSGQLPLVKTDPCETQKNQEDGTRETATTEGEPGVSNFFSFTSAPQASAQLPKAMTSEIKHKPITLPMEAHYHSHKPEDELKYGGDDGDKIKTIPIYVKDVQEDSEDSDVENYEKQEKEMAYSQKFSRYFKSNTVFSKYDFKSRKVDATRLGVHEKKIHILNSLEKARVVIIEGFTGCGKTTQVPQYILDKCCEEQKICNIVVTQPRKIAAISVARRVCYERNWSLGSVVGYQVGMESKTDRKDTVLTFMTTGVLLQKLISLKSLKDFTHIIIDEVHERDLESDFLLLVIKKIMSADREGKERHIKLILMSATIDTKKFENYFIFERDGEEIRPHVVKIPFVARHRVEELYLDHLLMTKPDQLQVLEGNIDMEKAMIQEEIYDICVSCIISMDEDERENNPDPRLRNSTRLPKQRGAVLVFLPGMEEIKRLQRALEKAKQEKMKESSNDIRDPNIYRWAILPLHSSVTAEEQSRVFDPPGEHFRKIILSTNIAESSVTVPDISYVIDFCLTKSLCVDGHTNFTTLRMVWAAKSQCIQRKGRAGRVADGKVYRLIPDRFYQKLETQIQPEMQRSNLETVVLMCKKFDLDSPLNLLKDALDRPKISGIQRAVSTLKELGALTIEMKDKTTGRTSYTVDDGDLTFVGKVMSDLPIPQQCTRLILLGHCFGVMQEATIIAAGLSVKSLFQTGFQKQLDTYLEKMKHAKKSFSDLFALYNVYKFWIRNYSESGAIPGDRRKFTEYKWAKGAMVHLPVLREIKSTVELLEERLKRLGITDSYSLSVDQNAQSIELSSEQGLFLKLAIAGAFYPHYFLRRRPDLRQYEREINKEVIGHDVFRTVFFKGFPASQKGKLYAKHVADYLSCGVSVPSVKFDGQKVLAIFDNSTGDTIGPFNTGIFRAIKLRQLRTDPLEFKVLWSEDENREMYRWDRIKRERKCTDVPPLRSLPPVDTTRVRVRVQHIISPAQFWVVIDQDFDKLKGLTDFIHKNISPIPLPPNKLYPNILCLAPFDGLYYRAKVLRTDNSSNPNAKSLVYFVDFGNSQWVSSSCLYDFSPYFVERGVSKAYCMAIECRLKELRPNIVHGLHWSPESIDLMKRFCNRAPNLGVEIFSIHQSVMIGELFGFSDSDQRPYSLNDLLLAKDDSGKLYGEFAPEPYLSMENHRKRCRASIMDDDEKQATGIEQIGDSLDLDFIEPPTNGRTPVTLKGPWSPLEMAFQACVKCSNTKEVKVENSSVNSVLLDHEPTTSNSRMLVASHVSVTKSEACMIRDNTVMPAIPGILSLVTMIFSPKVEFRVDRNQSKYTGIVCGCGTVPDPKGGKAPVHPDNTMEVVFDTEIDDEDIDRINSIRYYLNLIVRNSRGVNKSEYHKLLRENVIRLLRRQRKKIEEEIWPQEEYVWDRISPEFLQTTISHSMVFEHDDIFLPHQKVLLNRLEQEEVMWDGGY